MTFSVITHAIHKKEGGQLYAYAPYVREMNLWAKHVDEIVILAPVSNEDLLPIETAYIHSNIKIVEIPNFDVTSLNNVIRSFFVIPKILLMIYRVMRKTDHIHLRCPGNIGLLGCLVQILFPKKPKTAKYAGNWDPKAKQPLSYNLQKWILSNTVFTKNMQVLVYGDWPNQSKNIKPFFTASYKNLEIEKPMVRDYSNNLKFVFVGTLAQGKQPLVAIQLVEALRKHGKLVTLDLYGEGVLRESLESYIADHNLEHIAILHGNQPQSTVKEAIKTAHFSILPSKSEGWPKALAEAMFFGAIPIATSVSCVPYMLDEGIRGILLENDLSADCAKILALLNAEHVLQEMSQAAASWSQQYTLDRFDEEIVKLL
ncbi:glycosyltransferase [Tamlana sp. 2_MG-2023]|uniref:glycosyltransferase family 4 protein n=1 Tax=unclassified Tamlana TaxID=2614803 RepID=UPI0026E40308|nr:MULTISPECIES: glycosyltransferase [unclassified Tamlana]MDO6758767.1 glycosyltransferase [Tamlana sp. 2_MG-2023]MDO6789466.1 glycosyltransferase [Tamlana sp. 1_MG-2023]